MLVHATCSLCGSEFEYVKSREAGTKRTQCSESCRREARRSAYKKWYDSHGAKIAAVRAANTSKNPDYFKKHYAKNRERRKKERKEWYEANRTVALATIKAYAKAHPDQRRRLAFKSAHKRRSIVKKVFVEHVDPDVVFERDKGTCGICRKRVDRAGKWEIDHVIPISRGGAHAYANVQLAHRDCNRSKAAKLPVGQPNLFQVAV